ncbi:MAG TPA: OsmC family protein [Dongiaceae bacterium]|nr:OsmC family protein [Dongiaceae bacterium]
MAKYIFKIRWEKTPDGNESYSWQFDNGVILKADRGAAMIPGIVEPEAAFVASLASCHMLSFMAQAAKRGLAVIRYHDTATGILEKNRAGRICITRVLLQPQVEFSAPVDTTSLQELQDAAHAKCFIANSSNSQVMIDSTLLPASVT